MLAVRTTIHADSDEKQKEDNWVKQYSQASRITLDLSISRATGTGKGKVGNFESGYMDKTDFKYWQPLSVKARLVPRTDRGGKTLLPNFLRG